MASSVPELGFPKQMEIANGDFDESSDEVQSFCRLGHLSLERGEFTQAIASFKLAIKGKSNHPEIYNSLGISFARAGMLQQAIETFRDALSLKPRNFQVLHNLGVAYAQRDDVHAAMEFFRESLQIDPSYAQAHVSLANALASQGKHDDAILSYRKCLKLCPDSEGALNGLGLALISAKRSAEAVVYLQQAARLRPDFAGAWNNLGLALAEEGRYSECEAAFERALGLDPKYIDAHVNFGNAFKEQGQLQAALMCYDLALCLLPDSASARWNRSLALLQLGDYENGWREYESRWHRKGAALRSDLRQPTWDGSPLSGKTILVHMEQGLGDAIQFVRYAGMLKAKGARVVVECPPPLFDLFSSCPAIDLPICEGVQLPEYDVHIPVMSLPWIFETRLETVPQNIPYLFADQKRLSFWAERLKQYKGLKVGIAWQGNPHHQWDRHRSIELASFLDLGTIQGINLFSLQRGPGAEQIQKNSAGRVVQLLDPTARDSDGIMDVTAIMKCLDLVITVDTATAHLAGALGVTVWVLLSTMVDWRWLLMREDTPWYPSMRLFRQATRGNWSAVLERVSAELTKMSGVTDAVIR